MSTRPPWEWPPIRTEEELAAYGALLLLQLERCAAVSVPPRQLPAAQRLVDRGAARWGSYHLELVAAQ